MEKKDILCFWQSRPNVSPVLKLASMILLLALRDQADSVSFARKRGKVMTLKYTPKAYGECDMVPPPRHLFGQLARIFRHMGRESAKNPESAFSFAYTEAGEERKFVFLIDHGKGESVSTELNHLFFKLYAREEVIEDLNRKERQQQALKRQLMIVTVASTTFFFTAAVFWIGAIFFYSFVL